jgi:hypothetical protein
MFDGQQLGEDVVSIVRSFMEREIAPMKAENESLKARIAALEARPQPEKGEDGKSIDPAAVEAMVEGAVAKAVAELPAPQNGNDGKDAAGIVEALKDNGELVLTLADGRLVRTGIRDGEKGLDGRDGFSLDDFDCEPVDERTMRLKFTRGEETHSYELVFPVPVYRDVYKEGTEYERGDMVTWGGAVWHCDAPTKDKPGTENWTLAVKKGRDGKDAKPNG